MNFPAISMSLDEKNNEVIMDILIVNFIRGLWELLKEYTLITLMKTSLLY
jgi:hypothetical protein